MSTQDADQREVARRLVQHHGRLFAADAGIELADEPAPLWQLLVTSQLLSTRISADIALATARELWRAGWTTPRVLAASTHRQRVVALGRGGYRRYDESTSARLGQNAALLVERWDGDLRALHREAGGKRTSAAKLLQSFDGIGPTGAGIFLREVQLVWDDLRPVTDKLVTAGATTAGLPSTPDQLAGLVAPADFAHLAAALVRVARDPGLLD